MAETIEPGPNSWSIIEQPEEARPQSTVAPPVPTAEDFKEISNLKHEEGLAKDYIDGKRVSSGHVAASRTQAPFDEHFNQGAFNARHAPGGIMKTIDEKSLPAKPNKDSPASRMVKNFFSRKRSDSDVRKKRDRSRSPVKREYTPRSSEQRGDSVLEFPSTELAWLLKPDVDDIHNKKAELPDNESTQSKETLGAHSFTEPEDAIGMAVAEPPKFVDTYNMKKDLNSNKEYADNMDDEQESQIQDNEKLSEERQQSIISSQDISTSRDGILFSSTERLSPTLNDNIGHLRSVNVEGAPRIFSQYGSIETATLASKASSDPIKKEIGSTPLHTPKVANVWSSDPRQGNTLPPWGAESLAPSSIYSPLSRDFPTGSTVPREIVNHNHEDESNLHPAPLAPTGRPRADTPISELDSTLHLSPDFALMEQRLHSHIDRMQASTIFQTSTRAREVAENSLTRMDELASDIDRISMSVGYFRQAHDSGRGRQTQDIINRIDEVGSRLGDPGFSSELDKLFEFQTKSAKTSEETFVKITRSLNRLHQNLQVLDHNSNELSDRVGEVDVANELRELRDGQVDIRSRIDDLIRKMDHSNNAAMSNTNRRFDELAANVSTTSAGFEKQNSGLVHLRQNLSALSGDMSNLRVAAGEAAAKAAALAVHDVDEMVRALRRSIMDDISREVIRHVRRAVSDGIARHVGALKRDINREIPRFMTTALGDRFSPSRSRSHHRNNSTGTVEGLRGSETMEEDGEGKGLRRTRSKFEKKMQERARSAPRPGY